MTTIKTKDFILRQIRIEDAKAYFESMNDKESKKNFMSVPKNLSEAKKELRKQIKAFKTKTGETFAIEVNGEYAGQVELHDMNQKHHEHKATIGIVCILNLEGRA